MILFTRHPDKAETPAPADLREAEFEKIRGLYADGLVQQIWLRGDAGGACMIVEAASTDEVAEKLNALPSHQGTRDRRPDRHPPRWQVRKPCPEAGGAARLSRPAVENIVPHPAAALTASTLSGPRSLRVGCTLRKLRRCHCVPGNERERSRSVV